MTQTSAKLSFIELWSYLAVQIGNSDLPLELKANNVKELFGLDGQCPSFIKEVISLSYQQCHCKTMHSPVSIETILDILGETAYQLQQNRQDDLLNIELLEEIAWHMMQKYGNKLNLETTNNKKQRNKSSKPAQVVSFPDYKIRRANLNF